MSKKNVTKFLNQLIKTAKQNIKSIGIITDKDGTLLLDTSLKQILQNLNEKNLGADVYLIANSGRTVQDMINCLEQENIPVNFFDYIIGDNGGMCLDVKRNKQLYKHVIDKEVVHKIIQEFLKMEGNLSDIRLTDGKNIYAYESDEVREYYKNSKDVIFRGDLSNIDEIDITKITLTQSREQIDKINQFIRENVKGYKTHIGKTSFPCKSKNNYRLDFTRNAYKGRSI